jgi:hypothetical protein
VGEAEKRVCALYVEFLFEKLRALPPTVPPTSARAATEYLERLRTRWTP